MSKYAGLIATTILAGGFEAAFAEEILATRNIRSGEIIAASDITTPTDHDALRRAVDIVGKEAKKTIYKGQAVEKSGVKAPTLIKRNSIVQMAYNRGPMTISAEGRALDNGALGDRIRVMNLGSKRIVTVVVTGADSVAANI